MILKNEDGSDIINLPEKNAKNWKVGAIACPFFEILSLKTLEGIGNKEQSKIMLDLLNQAVIRNKTLLLIEDDDGYIEREYFFFTYHNLLTNVMRMLRTMLNETDCKDIRHFSRNELWVFDEVVRKSLYHSL